MESLTPTARFKNTLVFWKLKSLSTNNITKLSYSTSTFKQNLFPRKSLPDYYKFNSFTLKKSKKFWTNVVECELQRIAEFEKTCLKYSNMNNSYNNSTLSRCQTPNSTLGSINRPSPSPKCFGRNTHV